MSEPRQHHEVPRFYLEYFKCKHSGMVEVFDLDDVRGYQGVPSEVATFRDSYAFTREDGTKDHSLEASLGKIESIASNVYEGILVGEELSEQGRRDFATFIASMYVRSPRERRKVAELLGHVVQNHAYMHASNESAWAQIDEEMKKAGRYSPDASARVRQLFLDPSRLKISILREATLLSFAALAETAEAVFDMNWTFVRASNGTFITSDSPVTLGTLGRPEGFSSGLGLRTPEAMLSLPLSPEVIWLGHWTNRFSSARRAKEAEVKDFNRITADYCDRRIFARPLSNNLQGLGGRRGERVPAFSWTGFGPKGRAKIELARRIRNGSTT